MYRSALIAIAIEFVAEHEEYQEMTDCIYHMLRKTLSATKRNWKTVNKKHLVLERKSKSAGNLLDTRPPMNAPAVYDTVEHSGLVLNDDDGPVTLDFNLKLFLSPGVHAAEQIYQYHNFTVDTLKRDNWNSADFLDTWCHALEYKREEGIGFSEMWGCVLGNLEEMEDYYETKRRQYATTSESSNDDSKESDSEDDY